MRIHQVLVSASPGDAITNSALEVRQLLRRVAPSEVFARYIDPALEDDVRRLDDYDRGRVFSSKDDVILFHASIGEPHVFSFITERPERIVLVYHNISPAKAFMPYDPAFAGLLEAGRNEVAALRDRVVLALADSDYNAQELRDMGYEDVRVSRLIVDVDSMQKTDADPLASDWLSSRDGPAFLFVGQMLPHKRPDLLLKAFYVLTTHLLPDANLYMVGASRLHAYTVALGAFVRELNLTRAVIRGAVTQEELISYYRNADVFVTASEHEGFCVPLLEAMSFEVPIVARAHGAIPETLAGAGLLLPGDDDPFLLAEGLAEMCTNDDLRERSLVAGRGRLEAFDPDRARAELLEHLATVV